MQAESNTLLLTPTHRIVMISLVIIQYILFLWSNLLLTNYHSFKLPFLQYESMASTTCSQTHYLRNSSLYLLFWLQHILMATLKYKVSWHTHFKYFVLYDRYLFNIASGLTLWFCFSQAKPSNIHLFTLPLWFCLPISIMAIIILYFSIKQLGGRVMMPYKMKQIINSKYLNYDTYDCKKEKKLKMDGIYGYLRHPMQAGALLLILFGNNVYTTQRLLFAILMGSGVIIGVYMQEKRLIAQFPDYQEYKVQVKSRFIPFI